MQFTDYKILVEYSGETTLTKGMYKNSFDSLSSAEYAISNGDIFRRTSPKALGDILYDNEEMKCIIGGKVCSNTEGIRYFSYNESSVLTFDYAIKDNMMYVWDTPDPNYLS